MRDGKRGSFPRYVGASRSDRTHGQFRTALIDFTIERRGRDGDYLTVSLRVDAGTSS